MQRLTEAFSIRSTLYENNITIIYRATRQADGRRVILKTHKRREDAHKIRHEYDLLKGLRIEGISNVIDIFNNNEELTYLVSEDHGGIVMEDFLRENTALDDDIFLTVAENASVALQSIHASRIVHRDIKPANMLIEPETLKVWYIDFGISVQAKRGMELWQETVEGTLEYLSPEQTGRVNKPIDYRSDLYSLGVTLYRARTGRLPFTGRTTMELIHAHIAAVPTPPEELVDTSPIISWGLLKLLEKKPEDRYQTAESLVYDIQRCRLKIAEGEDPNAFKLAEKDIFYNLEPGRKLYGKKAYVEELCRAFDGIGEDAHPVLTLMEGGPAVGKSMILSELERYAARQNSLVFRAEFSQGDHAEPYATLRAAFGDFDALVYGSRISLSSYRERILDTLGTNTQALIDILPQMQAVLGKQPPVPRLGPVAAQRRAEEVFSTFLQIICDVPCPCLMLLDNAHWADDATLRLLFAALANRTLTNCMLVLSYQDEDYAVGQRLDGFIQAHPLQRSSVLRMHIQPLTAEDVVDIIADVFPQEPEGARELADHVQDFARGSMRRVEAYLKDLYHSGVLAQRGDGSGLWRWQREAINPVHYEDLRTETEKRLARLSEDTLYCLGMLSCLGHEVPLEQMETAFMGEMSLEEALEHLAPAISAGLYGVHPRSGLYVFETTLVQQLVYARIPDGLRAAMHYKIGKRLYRRYSGSEAELLRHCAVITDQCLRAGLDQTDNEERTRVMRMNRRAGDAAYGGDNMEKAARYYEAAVTLLGSDPFAGDTYEDAVGIYMPYAACVFALRGQEDGLALYHTLIDHVKTEGERYDAYYQLAYQHLAIADWVGAETYAAEYMNGSPLMPDPEGDLSAQVCREEELLARNEAARGLDYFLRAQEATDPQVVRQGSMLGILAESAVVNLNPLGRYYVFKALNYAYEHGLFPDLENAIALYAERVANQEDFPRAKAIYDMGLAYVEQRQLPQSVLHAVYCAVLVHWAEPLDVVPAVYQRAKHYATLEGTPYYAAFADLMLLSYELFTGTSLSQVARDIEAALYNAEKFGISRFQLIFSSGYRQFVRCMTGRTRSMDSFDDRVFSEARMAEENAPVPYHFNEQIYVVYRMMALYTYGYYDEAATYARRLEGSAEGGFGAFLTRVEYYYYYSLTLIALIGRDRALMDEYLPIIYSNQRHLQAYAQAAPGNFAMRYDMVALMLRCLLEGMDMSAIQAFSAADDAFRRYNCLWDRGLIEETLAAYWKGQGIAQYQESHHRNALEIYRALGAKLKVMQYAGVGEETSAYDSPTLSTTTLLSSSMASYSLSSSDSMFSSALDYQAILGVISCLVSEEDLTDLMQRLLSLLMENGGADQALLLLWERDQLLLRAFRYSDRNTHGLISHDLPMPLSDIDEDVVPHRLINMTANKRVKLVANAADNEFAFLGDPYLEKQRPESFIAMPVMAQDKLIGVIYLENTRLPGVFPPPRVHFLNAIVLQASLLIQNALDMYNLENYTQELEKRLTSYIGQLNTLIAGIAHEINSPLGVCVTVATRLLERAREVRGLFDGRALSKQGFDDYLAENGEGLDILTNNITRASGLVQNFKKISVDQSSEVFEELELMSTLRNICEYIRPAVKRVIDSFTVLGPETLLFYTSTGPLAQIFTNLIMNSAIHAFPGMDKADCQVTVDVTDGEDFVYIVYSDNGRGMTPEIRENVFMPFYTTRRGEGGSGLGGHIILTLVTQTLRGAIHCVSAPDQGTSFHIKLPKHLDRIEEEDKHAGQ